MITAQNIKAIKSKFPTIRIPVIISSLSKAEYITINDEFICVLGKDCDEDWIFFFMDKELL